MKKIDERQLYWIDYLIETSSLNAKSIEGINNWKCTFEWNEAEDILDMLAEKQL